MNSGGQEFCIVGHEKISLQADCACQMNGVCASQPARQGSRIHQIGPGEVNKIDAAECRIDQLAWQTTPVRCAMELRVEQH